jgi:predicted MFS family arabinose efflux permease
MIVDAAPSSGEVTSRVPAWSAVFALTLCVGTLIASEFMPISLLTPIGSSLHMTEGQVGNAIGVSGLFALVTSLSISQLTARIDRRAVLLALTLVMAASSLVVTFAPNALVFMVGRALIGVVIGGFWSMSAATVMRLVPEEQVTRALGLLNGGNALATTIAAPVGSYLGQYIGWRGAFFCVVPFALATLVWQFMTLPSLPPQRSQASGSVFRVLRRPQISLAMLAVMTFFMGQFALFTYLRPFLENVTQVQGGVLSAFLLAIGGAGVLGTYWVGFLLKRRLYSLLVAMPLIMAVIAVALIVLGGSGPATALLLVGWGLVATAAPVAWWTLISKALPDDAEAGGGLMVAVIQLAITAGASLGGFLFDTGGYPIAFGAGAAILLVSSVLAFAGWRATQRSRLDRAWDSTAA